MGYYTMFDKKNTEQYRQQLFALLMRDAFRKEAIILSSGKQSSYYIDARTVTLNPEGAFYVAGIMLSMAAGKDIKAIGGPTIGADPIVGAIAALSFLQKIPLSTFIVRKTAKAHGKGKQIEGPALAAGSEVVIIDDVATTGSSLVDSALVLRQIGLIVREAFVIVDRQEGARESLQQLDISLNPIFTTDDFLKS
jgi:orotate phosphoribosyltransferase